MGGATVSQTGRDVNEVLEKLKTSILNAIPMGLLPDSDVALYQPSTKVGKIFQAQIVWKTTEYGEEYPADVLFFEKEKGRNVALPITVTAHYGHKPEKDEWIGCLHLH